MYIHMYMYSNFGNSLHTPLHCYLSLGEVLRNDREHEGCHGAVLVLHAVVSQDGDEVLVTAVLYQVTLTRLEGGREGGEI